MYKRIITFFCSLIVSSVLFAQNVERKELQWFTEAKIGLFLHWGLYSVAAGDWNGHPTEGGEHFMLYERIPWKEYATLANGFNPVQFDAGQWVKSAKQAGMKYIVITAKHHDGFAMYNSACSNYNIVQYTPYGKDPLKALADECHKQGMRFGFYYSLGRDWEDPDVPTNWPTKGGRSNTWDYPDEDSKDLSAYIERKVKPQIRELLTNYGTIDLLWFDTPELVTKQQSEDIKKLIESLQPNCLINSRIGNGLGDFSTIEQSLAKSINRKPWEGCLTMGKNWGYNRYDTVYKSPDVILRHMADIVSKGGNMLLNIGPDSKGRFPALTKPVMKTLHWWLKENGEAIYGAQPWRVFGENLDINQREEAVNTEFHDAIFNGFPKDKTPDFRFTVKGKNIYVIVRHVTDKTFVLRSFKTTDAIASVQLLDKNKEVEWESTPQGLKITIDSRTKLYPVYVLRVNCK